jgi:tRNA(Ile)-lysidine synthase
MLTAFQQNMDKLEIRKGSDSCLLAISGGADSVVLAHLLKKANYSFTMAHCNFQLRGNDSMEDENFCRKLAADLDVSIHVKHFDVPALKKQKKISTQMAARDLRYEWFQDLMQELNINYLLTAHHGTDVAETMILNLAHGTGIKGMKGMSSRNGNIIRPLLPFTKHEISQYAVNEQISFRHDHSNDEVNYQRNFVRLKIMPLLAVLNDNIERTMMRNSRHFAAEGDVIAEFLQEKRKEIIVLDNGHELQLSKQRIKKEKHRVLFMHSILEELRFSPSQEQKILKNILSDTQSGRLYQSATHTLAVDRELLIIKPTEKNKEQEIIFPNLEELKKFGGFKIEQSALFQKPLNNQILIREQQLTFPVKLRHWKQGDKFQPFGMKGFKLLSDFFKDKKLNYFEKNECWLLENGNGEIIWVVGHRSDERYRIHDTNGQFLKITQVE